MPGFADDARQRGRQRSRELPVTGKDVAEHGRDEPELPEVSQHGIRHLPRSRRLPADHAAVGHAERDRSQQGRDPLEDSVWRVSEARGAGRRRTPARDNYGGPVVTANGLLFIGATTYDNKFHVYDKPTGKLLWETTLPAAGNATPSTYVVNGKQYIVIACGGGKERRAERRDVRGVRLPVKGRALRGEGRGLKGEGACPECGV